MYIIVFKTSIICMKKIRTITDSFLKNIKCGIFASQTRSRKAVKWHTNP